MGQQSTPPEIQDLIRQWQARLKQCLPCGGPRGVIVVAVLAVAGQFAWMAYYTVPSDSVAIVRRFGKYLKDVPAGLHEPAGASWWRCRA